MKHIIQILFAMAVLALPNLAPAATAEYTFTTLAGLAGSQGSADGTGSAAQFRFPTGVAVDSAGNVYVADTENYRIRKVTAGGVVTTLAGRGAGSEDGTGTAAQFNLPTGVAVDSAGNVYVADWRNHAIRKVSTAGMVKTLAGLAGSVGSANGTGNAARFNHPSVVAVDNAGNVYVSDTWNHTIRKVTAAGVVTTLAGLAGSQGSANGTGSAARFNNPKGVALDSAGNAYVSDEGNHTIRKVTAAGMVTTLAGLAGSAGNANGTGSAARFFQPEGVAVDSAGNVYVADMLNETIRKVTAAGMVTTLAGLAGSAGNANGTGSATRFYYPTDVAVDSVGNVYVADYGNSTIRKGVPSFAAPTITGQPQSQTNGVGATANFTVTTTGATPMSYQWYKSVVSGQWSVVSGATRSALSLQPLAMGDAGNYFVVVTNAFGSVTSAVVTLHVLGAPQIVRDLPWRMLLEGATNCLRVQIEGLTPMSFQWFYNGQAIPDATNTDYAIATVSASHAGTYMLVVSNALGVITNQPATIGVNNVVLENPYPSLVLTAPAGTPLELQYAAALPGPWSVLASLTLPTSPYLFIDAGATNTAHRFYRTTQTDRLQARLFPGWILTAAAGSQHRIEYVESGLGFTNWQFLTNLTLPSSPYLFTDTTATNPGPRFYRTTPLP